MPKNVIIPQVYGGGLLPPVAEQSIRFDRTRLTLLHGYSPSDDIGSDLWTVSGWFKMTNDQGFDSILWSARQDANNYTQLRYDSLNRLWFQAAIGGVVQAEFRTNRRIMDPGNWYHIMVVFGRTIAQLDLYVNGYLWPSNQFVVSPTIANVAGYSWLDSSADHAIGGIATPAEHFSGGVAEVHCSNNGELVTAFGQFNSIGVWERIAYVGAHGPRGFYLTFGRTVALGEDFSGNNNDFPTHDNGGSTDQLDDWMERNYCVIDVHNSDTAGTVTEAGLVLGAANGRVTMQPAANTGVWYYERNGVGVTWDTGVSGRFNPLLTPASYNFGQSPWVGVGPGGGELVLCSPNLPVSDIPISRDYFAAIGYEGDGTSPRTIASPAISQGDSEYADIVHRSDLVWVRNMEVAVDHQQSHRLRTIPNQLLVNDVDNETASLADGYVSDLLSTGFEVTAGGSTDNNVNNSGDLHSAISWRISKFAENQRVTTDDESDAEELVASGTVDFGSSDLELGSEDGAPGEEQIVGMHWKNLQMGQADTITAARIQFECDTARNDQPNELEIWAEDEDDALEFTETDDDLSDRTRTSASVLWSPAQWTTDQRRSIVERTPDISGPVQEVVDRGGWAPGNDLVILIENESGGTVGRHEAEAGNTSAENGAMLQVAWEDGGLDNGMSLFTYGGVGKIAMFMHGLDAVPEFLAVKKATSGAASWFCYHSLISATDLPSPEDGYISFNTASGATDSATIWNDTPPDDTFFTVGSNGFINEQDAEFVGWAMREVEGFSKLFSYTGNGATTGPSIYCGFKPRLIIIKETGPGGNGWFFGHRAAGFTPPSDGLFNQMSGNALLDSITVFAQDDNLALFSHGFRVIDNTGPINNNNSRYVGIAFAEAPFKTAKATP